MRRDITLKSILILFVLISSAAAQQSPAVAIDKIRAAVVTLTAYDSQGKAIQQGSGFFISRDGRLLTNRHLLKGASWVEARAGDGTVYTVRTIIAEDRDLNIIQLRVASAAPPPPFLSLNNIQPESGQYVTVISPQGDLAGSVSTMRHRGDRGRNFLISADLPPGATGGPVIDRQGAVLGIAARQVVQGQALTVVIASGRVLALVDRKDCTLADWNAGLAAEPLLATEALYFTGIDRLLNDDYARALAPLEEVTRRSPNDAEAWLHCGYAKARGKRYAEALRDYQTAVRLAPDYPDAFNNLGTMYDRTGRYKEALEAYTQAIKRRPDFAQAYNNLGAAYDHLGRYDDAIAAYKQALRLAPLAATTHLNLGVAYDASGRREEAVAALRAAIQIQHDYAEAHNYLGVVLHKLGRDQEAGGYFKQAIELKPDFAEAVFNLGVNDVITGNNDLAFAAYGMLKGMNKNLASRLFNLLGSSYTVEVTARRTGAARPTDSVQARPSRAALERLIDTVNQLVTTGALRRGAADGLIAMLRVAAQQPDNGNDIMKINLLNDFIDRVTALINADDLPADGGQRLIDAANAIINRFDA